MAIEIKATPAAYSSVHDDLIYTIYSDKVEDPTAYPNYKYIADVYVNSVLVARIKKIQDPTTGIGVFNVGQVVRNYLSTEFNPASGLRCQQLGSAAFHTSVVLKFGEEYNFTAYIDEEVDSARNYFNHYNGRLIGATTALSSFTNKIASNRPDTGKVLLISTHCFIPYFPTSTTAVNVTVTPYGGGAVYNTSFSPSNAYDLQILNVAPQALPAGTINASTTYYTVQVGSQTYTFDVVCEAIHTPYTLHFMNQYGGFESFIFQKVSRRTIDITKKDFGKVPYSVDSDGVVSKYNSNYVYYETRATYSSQYVEKLDINSDLLTDEEYLWLEDLVLSPMVYLQDGAYFIPILIKANNYEPRKVINDELTNLTLSIEFGTQLQAQGR